MKIFATKFLAVLGLIFLVAALSRAHAGSNVPSASADGYTFALPNPDVRLDAEDTLSGPNNWVGTLAPVEPLALLEKSGRRSRHLRLRDLAVQEP